MIRSARGRSIPPTQGIRVNRVDDLFLARWLHPGAASFPGDSRRRPAAPTGPSGAGGRKAARWTRSRSDLRHRRNAAPTWPWCREFFGKKGPASTLVQISALAYPDWLIEIEAIAYCDRQEDRVTCGHRARSVARRPHGRSRCKSVARSAPRSTTSCRRRRHLDGGSEEAFSGDPLRTFVAPRFASTRKAPAW